MTSLIRRDLILSFGNKQSLFILVFYPLMLLSIIGIDNSDVWLFASILSFTYLLSIVSFAYESVTKSHLLINSLPIKKWEVVVSKYIFVIINYVFSLIYTYFYVWILGLLGLNIMDSFNLSIIKHTFFFTLLSLSIGLPLLYLLPPKIARFVYIFIFIIVTNLSILDGAAILLRKPTYAIFIVILYLVSLAGSIVIYKNKDFY